MEYSIREFRQEDTADLARAANYAEIAVNLRDAFPYPYLFTDAVQFIANSKTREDSGGIIARAICVDDRLVGVVSLTPGKDVASHTAEIGYFVTPAYRGKGIASKAVQQLSEQYLDGVRFDRIYAMPFSSNHASHLVLEKAGFTREGTLKNAVHKDGRVLDAYIYALTIDSSDGSTAAQGDHS